MELATQLLLLANAGHALLVPVIAQFLQSVTGGDIGQLVDVRLGKDGPLFGPVHLGCYTSSRGRRKERWATRASRMATDGSDSRRKQ